MLTSRKAMLALCLILIFLVSSLFAVSVYAQDPTADPNAPTADPMATADPNAGGVTDPNATADPNAGGTTGGTTATGVVCDTSTITLLIVAKYFGYADSPDAIDLTGYDLGDAGVFYNAITPMTRPEGALSLDEALADPTLSDAFITYAQTLTAPPEGSTTIGEINAQGEDPACLTLRQSATQYVLLSLLYNQMQNEQMGSGQ